MKVCPDGFITMELATEKLSEVLARARNFQRHDDILEDFCEAVREHLAGPGALGQPVVLLAVELRDVEDALREEEGAPLSAEGDRRAKDAFLRDWEGSIEFSSIPEALRVVIDSRVGNGDE
jgi:hypothetical protein